MSNALMVLILFLLTAYVINKYLSPKTVKTKKDNAKLWLVRFTSLYMGPVISQFFNPTIPIVKERGILGLLAPYIFVAIIVYGLGYFFGNIKKTSTYKKNGNKKNINLDIKNGVIILLLVIATFLLFNKNSNFIPSAPTASFSNLSEKDLSLVCKGEVENFHSESRSYSPKEQESNTFVFKNGNFRDWNCEWTDKKIVCKDPKDEFNVLGIDRLSSSYFMEYKFWIDKATNHYIVSTSKGSCEIAKQRF